MYAAFNQTWKYMKRIADLPRCSFGKIAQKCGVKIQTAEAWGREPESNTNPHGTGREGPLDCGLRLIATAHEDDPGLAREIAEMHVAYVDYLDGKDGTAKATDATINELMGKAAAEHTDVLVEILKNDDPNWAKVVAEIKQAEAALNRLHGYAMSELQNKNDRSLRIA